LTGRSLVNNRLDPEISISQKSGILNRSAPLCILIQQKVVYETELQSFRFARATFSSNGGGKSLGGFEKSPVAYSAVIRASVENSDGIFGVVGGGSNAEKTVVDAVDGANDTSEPA
jgi:hypothetical protein